MSNDHKKGPGTHYSAANPIPNIHKFIQSLDADKKERDERVNEESRAAAQHGDPIDHKQESGGSKAGKTKIVTDPTTGKEVEIEDVDKDFMDDIKESHVSIPPSLP